MLTIRTIRTHPELFESEPHRAAFDGDKRLDDLDPVAVPLLLAFDAGFDLAASKEWDVAHAAGYQAAMAELDPIIEGWANTVAELEARTREEPELQPVELVAPVDRDVPAITVAQADRRHAEG